MAFNKKISSIRQASQAGFAIGPILFVLAILAMIGGIMAAGFGDYGSASIIDRVAADITSQANLMRSAINQCNGQYLSYARMRHTEDGTYGSCPTDYTLSGSTCIYNDDANPYPHSAAGGTTAANLLCDPLGSQSIWANVNFPHPPKDFNPWTYVDASATGGGRCVWTTPLAKSNGMIDGLNKAAHKFTVQSICDNSGTTCNSEVIYDPASASLKFTLWITLPTGTPDSHCMP